MGKGGESKTKSGVSKKQQQVATDKINTDGGGQIYQLANLDDKELVRWMKEYGVSVGKSKDTRVAMLAALEPYATGILDPNRPAHNLPLEKPKFTLSDIRNAIPKHCFERNLVTSLTHLASDLALVAATFYVGYNYLSGNNFPLWVNVLLWPAYWYLQGAFMTGIWVLAHECGHQGFSPYESVNNFIGTILHSLLLVPYHSWRITHGKHHSNTGSSTNDEVFCPSTRSQMGEVITDSPIANAFYIVVMLTIGWMPGYLVLNVTGPAKYKGKNANHFSPSAVMFTSDQYWQIVQSDIAFLAAFALLCFCVYTFGFTLVAAHYLVPYMITNYHLVLITFLQHTDVYMPHFDDSEWSWLRGALCTVDRSFGFFLDHCFHHIADTHVCHHVFSKIPFYHAAEATEAIKSVVGDYYLQDETPIALALWRAFSNCKYIDDNEGIVFYKNK